MNNVNDNNLISRRYASIRTICYSWGLLLWRSWSSALHIANKSCPCFSFIRSKPDAKNIRRGSVSSSRLRSSTESSKQIKSNSIKTCSLIQEKRKVHTFDDNGAGQEFLGNLQSNHKMKGYQNMDKTLTLYSPLTVKKYE